MSAEQEGFTLNTRGINAGEEIPTKLQTWTLLYALNTYNQPDIFQRLYSLSLTETL